MEASCEKLLARVDSKRKQIADAAREGAGGPRLARATCGGGGHATSHLATSHIASLGVGRGLGADGFGGRVSQCFWRSRVKLILLTAHVGTRNNSTAKHPFMQFGHSRSRPNQN